MCSTVNKKNELLEKIIQPTETPSLLQNRFKSTHDQHQVWSYFLHPLQTVRGINETGVYEKLPIWHAKILVIGWNFRSVGPNAWLLSKEWSKWLIDEVYDQKDGSYLVQKTSIAIQRGNVANLLDRLLGVGDFNSVFYL